MVALLATFAAAARAAAPSPPPAPAWVGRSNANAQVLVTAMAKVSPEEAGFFGVTGMDERITDFSPGFDERARAAFREAVATLEPRLATEQDAAVRQDLQILIDRARLQMRGDSLERALAVPYGNLTQLVYLGLQSLLDDQIPAARRAAAVTRLKRYAGQDAGYAPITVLVQARVREALARPGRIGPFRGEVERDLGVNATYRKGIRALLEKYQLPGWQAAMDSLDHQLEAYDAFVRAEVLPRAREDFRLPPALYAHALEQTGVDMPVGELTSRATASFREIQNQMQALAPLVAKAHGWTATDYRDVIKAMKQQQLAGDAILAHYQGRIRDVEEVIRRERIVTLPARPAQVKLATAAETADIPAPHLQPPRLIGNTGERATFVLPLNMPAPGKALQFDDFTFEAASWTLTAHECRPGHELQFSSVIEKGVSLARALFAFNSVNVEGWGLYAEAEMQPYEPLDAQLVTLQHRLLRAARAGLDPGLQAGTVTRDQALRVLEEDVVLSEAMATQEVQRYTFLAPGQATAYFVGYNRLLEIRAEAERMLAHAFDRQTFNDFVVGQGLLPPALLRRAVQEQFVPERLAAAKRAG
jgi:uncharacterized protein DUF885